MKKKLFAIFNIILICASCSKDQEYDRKKAVSIFALKTPLEVSEKLKNVKVQIPKQKSSNFWNGSSALQNSKIQNFKKDFSLSAKGFFNSDKEISFKRKTRDWSFYGGKLSSNFSFSPIFKDDKLYRLGVSGVLRAINLKDEKTIWKKRIFEKQYLKNYSTPKISLSNNVIFAIVGNNKVAAVDSQNGSIIWKKQISSIAISAPVSDKKLTYVLTNDNKIYAFNSKDGRLVWTHSGILRTTAIFGAANPVIYKNLLIISYSSVEIYAVKKDSGEPIWSQDLNLSKAVNSNFYLNDIDATPVVKDGMIYTIGNGGLMMAIRAKDGNYLWKREISGITNFWLAKNFLYVINNDNKLLAVEKDSGLIKWISNLPNLKKEEKPASKIIYKGVIMAGDKLLIPSFDGKLLIVSPQNGEIEKTLKIKKKISHSPIIYNNKIYLNVIGRWTNDLIELN